MSLTLTRRALERKLSQIIGDLFTFAATANGASDGSTIVCATLFEHPGNYYAPFLCELTSGSLDGERRTVASFDQTTGALLMTIPFSGQVVSGVSFRLHRIHVDYKNEGLDEAMRMVRDVVPVRIVDDFITGELIRNRNAFFWQNTNQPYDWQVVSGIVTRRSAMDGFPTHEDDASFGLLGNGGDAKLRQYIGLEIELRGVPITFEFYVYGPVATAARITVEQGTNTQTATISLNNAWEKLSVVFTPQDVTEPIFVSLVNPSTTSEAYFGSGSLRPQLGQMIYWIPISTAFRNIHELLIGPLANVALNKAITYGFYTHPLPHRRIPGYGLYETSRTIAAAVEIRSPVMSGFIPQNYWMRLLGEGIHPALLADTDTLEITEEQADYIAATAGMRAIQKAISAAHMADHKEHFALMLQQVGAYQASLKTTVRKSLSPYYYSPRRL